MAGLLAADSVSHALQVQQWDGEVRQESKHAAELKQLDNGVKIPPRYTQTQPHITSTTEPTKRNHTVTSRYTESEILTTNVNR